jgi:hypothetical protein
LTVERGEAGASPDDRMEEVLSVQISPFGIIDIFPEQLCNILGLTVSGHTVSLSRGIPADRFDWSGRTTYWCSTHSMMLRDDAELLAAKICRAFPDVVILQPMWLWQPPRVRCRQVRFLMPFDEIATFAIGPDAARLERMLVADAVPVDEFESIRYPRIDLWCVERDDLAGSRLIKEKGAEALELDYHVIHHCRYRIWIEYKTEDARAHAIVQRLLQVFESHFCRGLEIVDLQTGDVIEEDRIDEEDTKSYSMPFRDWCLERGGRYLSVGVRREEGSEQQRFVGYRPITR